MRFDRFGLLRSTCYRTWIKEVFVHKNPNKVQPSFLQAFHQTHYGRNLEFSVVRHITTN